MRAGAGMGFWGQRVEKVTDQWQYWQQLSATSSEPLPSHLPLLSCLRLQNSRRRSAQPHGKSGDFPQGWVHQSHLPCWNVSDGSHSPRIPGMLHWRSALAKGIWVGFVPKPFLGWCFPWWPCGVECPPVWAEAGSFPACLLAVREKLFALYCLFWWPPIIWCCWFSAFGFYVCFMRSFYHFYFNYCYHLLWATFDWKGRVSIFQNKETDTSQITWQLGWFYLIKQSIEGLEAKSQPLFLGNEKEADPG